MTRVLVTGGSGFIGSHAILHLLDAGHTVRTTVRNLSREIEVRDRLQIPADTELGARVSFVAADLEADAGWKEAVEGCDYVLHVASPFPATTPKHEDDLIVPARDGALRVLRAARDAGVKRVVLTSSFAAVGYGHAEQEAPFDETTWTNVDDPTVSAYAKSKTIAERAAWDFMEREGGSMELASVNPVAVFGPVLADDYAASIILVRRLMDGDLPGCPDLSFGAVDVRDVVDLHLRAMTHPDAAGERFLAIAGDSMTMLDMARALKERLGPAARRVPARAVPNWVVRLVGLFDPEARARVSELGRHRNATSEKARQVLGWDPRPREEGLVATAESLASLGLLKGSK